MANSAGVISYRDVTINLAVSAAGVLTVGTPKVTASPTVLAGNFVAGRYRNGSYIFTVTGPGIASSGRTTWSIVGPPGCSLNAGWTSGPIAGHPQQARLNKLHITFDGYSYGASGYNGCFTGTYWWSGSLIGGAGGPGGLTLFSYTSGAGGTDSSTRSPVSRLCAV